MEKLLTVKEVCDAALVDERTFRRYRADNSYMFPPVEKKGNQLFFSIETVEEVKAYRGEMIRRRAHAKTAAPGNLFDDNKIISGAAYRTILLHAEKISNGQADFADVLKRELRELLSVEADNLIVEPVTVESVRNFLSTIPFIVEEDNGTRYRLVGNELELIEENHSVEKEKDAAENFSFLQRTDTNGDSSGAAVQNEQATFDTPADAPSTPLDICPEGSCIDSCKDTAEQAAPMGDAIDTQNENQPVETAAPVVFEDKPADVITLEQRADRIRKNIADVQRSIFEIGFDLIEAKKQVGHGNWGNWLQKEFKLSQQVANRFMRITERFSKLNAGVQFKSSTLEEMLALPEGTEEKFIAEQAKAGRPVETQKKKDIRQSIKEFKTRMSGEVGGGEYVNITGAEKNNAVVDELNHTDLGDVQAREGVPDNVPDNLHAPAEIDSEGVEDFQLTAQPPPVDNPAETAANPDKPSTGTVHYGTPDKYIEAARKVLGAIDLDPATFAEAQKHVKAKKFYTVEDNGLDKPWSGRVWLNPPYNTKKQKGSTIEQFIEKLISEVAFGNVTSAIVLTDAKTDTNWFRRLVDAGAAIVFTTQRINFMQLNGTFAANTGRYGQAFFYFGDAADKFYRVFAPFGWGCRVVKLPAEKEKGLFDVGEAVETC